jgi:hypothetical protein
MDISAFKIDPEPMPNAANKVNRAIAPDGRVCYVKDMRFSRNLPEPRAIDLSNHITRKEFAAGCLMGLTLGKAQFPDVALASDEDGVLRHISYHLYHYGTVRSFLDAANISELDKDATLLIVREEDGKTCIKLTDWKGAYGKPGTKYILPVDGRLKVKAAMMALGLFDEENSVHNTTVNVVGSKEGYIARIGTYDVGTAFALPSYQILHGCEDPVDALIKLAFNALDNMVRDLKLPDEMIAARYTTRLEALKNNVRSVSEEYIDGLFNWLKQMEQSTELREHVLHYEESYRGTRHTTQHAIPLLEQLIEVAEAVFNKRGSAELQQFSALLHARGHNSANSQDGKIALTDRHLEILSGCMDGNVSGEKGRLYLNHLDQMAKNLGIPTSKERAPFMGAAAGIEAAFSR